MIVIGIGTTSSATASDIATAVRALEARAGERCTLIATLHRNGVKAALDDAGRSLACPVTYFAPEVLAARSAECVTHSPASLEAYGIASVAEAAALAAAGQGSQLLVARVTFERVTAAAARLTSGGALSS